MFSLARVNEQLSLMEQVSEVNEVLHRKPREFLELPTECRHTNATATTYTYKSENLRTFHIQLRFYKS